MDGKSTPSDSSDDAGMDMDGRVGGSTASVHVKDIVSDMLTTVFDHNVSKNDLVAPEVCAHLIKLMSMRASAIANPQRVPKYKYGVSSEFIEIAPKKKTLSELLVELCHKLRFPKMQDMTEFVDGEFPNLVHNERLYKFLYEF